ncbi:MAG: hypothetical protein ACI9DJ_000176 [Algoriphagus sp.]|jgi:hypothetical protein
MRTLLNLDFGAHRITASNSDPKIHITFFATPICDDSHDSVMYVNIKRALQKHSNWTILTLTGKLHNKLITYKGEKKMTLYLSEDFTLGSKKNLFNQPSISTG